VSPIGVLFVLLTAGLAAIGIYALTSGALLIAVAALVLSGWMASLAFAALRRR
jgi:hypothetical protein